MTDGPTEDGAGPWPLPPRRFEDRRSRSVLLREEGDPSRLEALYKRFDPGDRAQGLPPPADRIPGWLAGLGDALHVVAEIDGDGPDRVGHAFLVPAGDAAAELAVFVLEPYRDAGIGTALVRSLLGLGAREGVRRVWLVVERTNAPAVRLYRKVGFRTLASDGSQLEMDLELPGGDDR